MIHCIYNTDYLWIESLKRTGEKRINFWREDPRSIKLQPGDVFYFRVRGTEFIAGKAQFVETKLQSIDEAWQEYGLGNGVSSPEMFRERAQVILKLKGENIRSIILENPQWLEEAEFIHISKKQFPPNILASKYFKDSEMLDIVQAFKRGDDNSRAVELDVDYGFKGYEEGRILLAKHMTRERSRALIESVKKTRKHICEICGFDFKTNYNINYIEAHHKEPLSNLEKDQVAVSKQEDIALLCANCHRAVHCYMRDWPKLNYKDIIVKMGELKAHS